MHSLIIDQLHNDEILKKPIIVKFITTVLKSIPKLVRIGNVVKCQKYNPVKFIYIFVLRTQDTLLLIRWCQLIFRA
jgi:hypothetical protein